MRETLRFRTNSQDLSLNLDRNASYDAKALSSISRQPDASSPVSSSDETGAEKAYRYRAGMVRKWNTYVLQVLPFKVLGQVYRPEKFMNKVFDVWTIRCQRQRLPNAQEASRRADLLIFNKDRHGSLKGRMLW